MGGFVSGITSGLGDLFGGSTPSQPNVQVYQPGGTGAQDQNLQNLLSANTTALSGGNNPYSQLSPQIIQAFQQLFNNPGTAGYTSGAGNAGQALTTIGNQAVNAAPQLNTAALSLLPGATSVMNMGLDPQMALYQQQLQQTNDQANVANAQYGLTGQQAAGNLNQADKNFNIDWQNNELQRAIAGLNAGGSAITNASGNAINASNLGTTGASNLLAGGAAPYNAANTIGNTQETALNEYLAQLLGPVTSTQQTIGNLSDYLGKGIGASAQGAQIANQDFASQMSAANSLGSGLSSIMGLFNNGGSGGGGIGSTISNFFSGTPGLPSGDLSNYNAASAGDSNASGGFGSVPDPTASSGGGSDWIHYAELAAQLAAMFA